jgi:hypothetical protein
MQIGCILFNYLVYNEIYDLEFKKMAIIKNGILGGFTGKVGTVVGITRGDKHHMRSLPNRRKKYTSNELVNQAKFKMVQDHLDPVKELIRAGFKKYYTESGGYRAALAYTRKVALVSDDAGFYIDPALFKISGGELAGAIDPRVTLVSGNQLHFSWDASGTDQDDRADQMMVLAYDIEKAQAITRIFDGAYRRDGEFILAVPDQFKGSDVDVYIGFLAADRSMQSDSQYLGRMEIPEG